MTARSFCSFPCRLLQIGELAADLGILPQGQSQQRGGRDAEGRLHQIAGNARRTAGRQAHHEAALSRGGSQHRLK